MGKSRFFSFASSSLNSNPNYMIFLSFVVLSILKASEAGVHRPHVSGMHGRDSDGAYSIVLAGGYEDDTVCQLTV